MRGWTLIVSFGLHGALALALAGRGEGARSDVIDLTPPIEVVMIEALPRETVATAVPEPAGETPAPAATRQVASRTTTTAPSPRGTPAPEAVAPAPVAPTALSPLRWPSREVEATPGGDGPLLRPATNKELARTVGEGGAPPPVGPMLFGELPYRVGPGDPDVDNDSTLGDPKGGGRYQQNKRTFTARTESDGTVHIQDNPNWQGGFFADPKEGVGYRASFDVTDWLMRLHGDDPYLYEKMKFMDETREERQQMALVDRQQKLRTSISKLPRLVAFVWNDERLTRVERRRLLFLLWDECAEEGADEVVRAAREARATIEGFVRREAPAGSDLAYSREELDALNADRESQAEFRPYDADRP